MTKEPLVFEATIHRFLTKQDGYLAARSARIYLCPIDCRAPRLPTALLHGLRRGEHHHVRITVERTDEPEAALLNQAPTYVFANGTPLVTQHPLVLVVEKVDWEGIDDD